MSGGHSASVRISGVGSMSGGHSASVRMVSSVGSMLGGHHVSIKMVRVGCESVRRSEDGHWGAVSESHLEGGAGAQEQTQSQLAQTSPTGVQDPQIGAFSRGQCVQHGQNSHGIHSQGAGKDEQDFSTQIDHVQRGINVEIGKLDSKLTKIALDINELKKHDKKYTEWYELTNAKFDSIINACSRIESTCQIQNDEMEDLSIFKMNDQLKTLQDHVLKIVENTNQFATHLAKSDSERQKLKNEIIANVEQIHKNYEPHMPRHSTPLTEEKFSVKGSFTPLLGENVVSVKDIPKLEEWPTFS
ncbi:hypothetical protein O181_129380, partial [Austropuccinia psidii MF-1]|nr:hypothetical protein [Austropuccinia psidii MF-1]